MRDNFNKQTLSKTMSQTDLITGRIQGVISQPYAFTHDIYIDDRITSYNVCYTKLLRMFMYGAISRLKADDSIEQLFYHGRSSISIGYIGVAETCEILAGNQDKQLATEILNFISGKCAEFDKRSNVAFSEYGTPSRITSYNVCYTKLLRNWKPTKMWRLVITHLVLTLRL